MLFKRDRGALTTPNLALDEARARIAQLEKELEEARLALTRPHFAADYNAMVERLLAEHPLEEAMAIAVGGSYDGAGRELVSVMRAAGLIDGMSIIDLGCGSGRVAHRLGLDFKRLDYTGIDVVQPLLDYAATKAPEHFRFVRSENLSLPAPDESSDMFVAFSVFTHLLHEESFLYLADARRVLRSGGTILFTILESHRNWPIFQGMVDDSQTLSRKPHLNMIIERSQVADWAERLGLVLVNFELGGPHDGHGQTVVFMRKP